MKNKIFSIFLPMSIMFLCFSVYVYASAAPEGWTITSTDDTYNVHFDYPNSKDGEVSLRFDTDQTEENSGITKLYQRITGLEKSTSYILTFWTKAENIDKYYLTRDVIYDTDLIENSGSSFDWKKRELSFTTTKNATATTVQFNIRYGNGLHAKVWLDGVSLYKAADGTSVGNNLVINGSFDQGVDITPPKPVTGLYAEPGGGEVTLNWNNPSDEDLENILIYCDDMLLAALPNDVETYVASNLENNKKYNFKVVASDETGITSEAAIVSAIPKTQAPAPKVTADDENNVITGMSTTMEIKIDEGVWTDWSDSDAPDLSGCHICYVRYKAAEGEMQGKETVLLFYANHEPIQEATITVEVDTKISQINFSGKGIANEEVMTAARYSESSDYTDVVFLLRAITDKDGVFNGTFNMPDNAKRGKYQLWSKQNGTSISNRISFDFVPELALREFIDKIKGENEETVKSLLFNAENKDILRVLDIRADDLYSLNNDNLSKLVSAVKKEQSITEENFSKISNDYIALGLISQSETQNTIMDIIFNYNSILDFKYEGVAFNDAETEGKVWIYQNFQGKSFDSLIDAQNYYIKMMIFYEINNSAYTQYRDTIKKHSAFLGITTNAAYLKFIGLAETECNYVSRVVKLANDSYKDTNELLKELEDAVLKLNNSDNSSSGGNGGGSGGSNKGNGTQSNQSSGIPLGVAAKEEKEKFSDIDSVNWAKDAILYLCEEGIVAGMENGKFCPDEAVTREQFSKMVAITFGLSESDSTEPFADVDKNWWSYQYIMALKENDIIQGYEGNLFMPQKNITREDMAVIIVRALGNNNVPEVREACSFTDSSTISSYAAESVQKLYCIGCINGTGNNEFSPKATATRAMAAKILYDIVQKK